MANKKNIQTSIIFSSKIICASFLSDVHQFAMSRSETYIRTHAAWGAIGSLQGV
jgi:hypothetical protein